MLVRALGLKSAAVLAEKRGSLPFTDVTIRKGYISVAYAIGMTNGTSASTFSPDNSATRAQAAAMLVRIYEKLQKKTDWVHGFYAISSYNQISLTDYMDAVSVGWSRMTWDGNTPDSRQRESTAMSTIFQPDIRRSLLILRTAENGCTSMSTWTAEDFGIY